MKIPYLELKVKNKFHKKNLLNSFEKILNHGRIINGPEIKTFEKKISKFLETKYVVGLSSGSSALYLALKSLNIGHGDEVITTPFTWIITINAIIETGAKPVFADIGDDLNIESDSIKKLITKKTKAIVPMHVGGHMCDMRQISKIAKDNNLYIVEDAAQAICGSLDGIRAGNFSEISAFSLNPMKILNAYGECGFISTNNKKLQKKILMLRHAGTIRDNKKIEINNCYISSLNHKMDTIQASFVLSNLKNLNWRKKMRDNISQIYDNELGNLINIQKKHKNEIHGRYLYIFTCNSRDKLYKYLKNQKIECKIFYSPLACDAPIFKKNYFKVSNARKLLKKSLSIPLHENLTENQVEFIVKKIKKFYQYN
tara:strand:+ start:1653 stop:2762 length:1110 start_codon:yes stop_codon:yes gene_type:complete